MTKLQKLQELKTSLENNSSLPLRATATQLVFGEGDPNAQVYFLGEAPGRFEDQSGRPFVGQAGKLLEKLLVGIGLTREDVYITSVVRFRPPNNRPPTPTEIAAFAPYVDEEIKIISPKLIATLGRFSLNKFMPDVKISEVHGKIFDINYQGQNLKLLPLYHPAAALRATKIKNILTADFKKIEEALK